MKPILIALVAAFIIVGGSVLLRPSSADAGARCIPDLSAHHHKRHHHKHRTAQFIVQHKANHTHIIVRDIQPWMLRTR